MSDFYAYLSLFFSSFLASTVLPFSSEGVLGMMLHQKYNVGLCIGLATLGNTLGGVTSYWLGYLGKWEWLEKYFGIKKEKILARKTYADRYGSLLAFFSWLPVVGDILAVALGFFRVRFWTVLFWMVLGKGLRYLVVYWLMEQVF